MIRHLRCTAAIGILLVTSSVAAAPILSVDMDPSTTGIQSTLSVSVGDVFTVDVVVADDGTGTIFDTVILGTYFNDAGVVLAPGPSGPLMGTLLGSPFALDLFASMPLPAPGTPLGVGPSVLPPPGFAGASGTIGLLDPLIFAVGPVPVSIYSIDFVAVAVGSSSILSAGSPFLSPVFAFGGFPVPLGGPGIPIPSTVTVSAVGGVVPEPSSLTLCALGMFAVTGYGWRRKRKLRR